MGAGLGLDALGGGQVDLGVVADALQDVGQEEVLGVEGNVQQEPGGGSSNEHPEVPAAVHTSHHQLSSQIPQHTESTLPTTAEARQT